jgi:hypothetical protein
LPPEEQEAAFARIGGIIFQKVMLRAVDILEEKDQEEMDRVIAANPENGAAIFEFLQAKIPGFDKIVSEEAASFKNDALGVMDQIQ